jgi:WG containing repeat
MSYSSGENLKTSRDKGWKINPYNGAWFSALAIVGILAVIVYAYFKKPEKDAIFYEQKEELSFEEVSQPYFSDGLALVKNKESELYGFIDFNYHLVIPIEYESAFPFQGGRALVVKNGKTGYINRYNKAEIPCIYNAITGYSEGLYCVFHPEKGWGYIDYNGNVKINYGWREASPFADGLASVENAYASWGYIDTKGTLLIPYQFEKAEMFNGGIAAVCKNKLWGFINKKGNG